MKTLTTSPNLGEFEKEKICLDKLSLPYEITSPELTYVKVGVPTIVFDHEARPELYANESDTFLEICSGLTSFLTNDAYNL